MVTLNSQIKDGGGTNPAGGATDGPGAPRALLSISVIITCYNQAHFLAEAIESVLNQTVRAGEVVVVDDGSTDNTAEVVGRYPEVRYLRHANRGVAFTRNVGLSAVGGDYVVLLDGDDRLTRDSLEISSNLLNERPECAFVAGHNTFIDADGNQLYADSREELVQGDYYAALLGNNFIRMPGMVMCRRRVFESVKGFTLKADHSCDYDLYLRIARKFPVYCHDKIVAEYRVHGNNTNYRSATMLKATMIVYRDQWKSVKGHPQYEAVYREGEKRWQERYGNEVVDMMWDYVQRGGHYWSREFLYGAIILLRYSPKVFVKWVGKKFARVTRG